MLCLLPLQVVLARLQVHYLLFQASDALLCSRVCLLLQTRDDFALVVVSHFLHAPQALALHLSAHLFGACRLSFDLSLQGLDFSFACRDLDLIACLFFHYLREPLLHLLGLKMRLVDLGLEVDDLLVCQHLLLLQDLQVERQGLL